MYAPEYAHLECQDCGAILRELTAAEQQKIARDPYNFIFYCRECLKSIEGSYESNF